MGAENFNSGTKFNQNGGICSRKFVILGRKLTINKTGYFCGEKWGNCSLLLVTTF